MLCASAQSLWIPLAFFMQRGFSLPQSAVDDVTGEPVAMAPGLLVAVAIRELEADRFNQALFVWRLAAVAQARSFEGPAAARLPDGSVPTRPFQARPIGAPPRRAGDDGHLLTDLLCARALACAHDHVRLPPALP